MIDFIFRGFFLRIFEIGSVTHLYALTTMHLIFRITKFFLIFWDTVFSDFLVFNHNNTFLWNNGKNRLILIICTSLCAITTFVSSKYTRKVQKIVHFKLPLDIFLNRQQQHISYTYIRLIIKFLLRI